MVRKALQQLVPINIAVCTDFACLEASLSDPCVAPSKSCKASCEACAGLEKHLTPTTERPSARAQSSSAGVSAGAAPNLLPRQQRASGSSARIRSSSSAITRRAYQSATTIPVWLRVLSMNMLKRDIMSVTRSIRRAAKRPAQGASRGICSILQNSSSAQARQHLDRPY